VLRRARKRWPGSGRHGIPTSRTGASTSIPVFSRLATLPRNSLHPFRTFTARHGKVVGLPTAQSDRASPSLGQRQTNRLCIKQSPSCTAPTLSPLCSGFALQVGSRSLSTENSPGDNLQHVESRIVKALPRAINDCHLLNTSYNLHQNASTNFVGAFCAYAPRHISQRPLCYVCR
jgi:hypothetical protein